MKSTRSSGKNTPLTTSLTTAELRHMHDDIVCDVTNRTVFIMTSQWII